MDTYPMISADMDRLINEIRHFSLEQIPDGSGSSHYDGPEGWIHGLSMARVEAMQAKKYPLLSLELRGIYGNVGYTYGSIVQMMLTRLEPGGHLDAHKDGPPNRARFHLPLITHPDALWWDEIEGSRHMEAGTWYGPVPYCGILHSVTNPSPSERIHLIVDFERGV